MLAVYGKFLCVHIPQLACKEDSGEILGTCIFCVASFIHFTLITMPMIHCFAGALFGTN